MMNNKIIISLKEPSLPGKKKQPDTVHLAFGITDTNKVIIPLLSACNTTCETIAGQLDKEKVYRNAASLHLCPLCRQIVLDAYKDNKPVTTKVAGHVFHLENINNGIHSEETADYSADLYCDGLLIGNVHNDGHGGMTFFNEDYDATPQRREFARKVRAEVEQITRMVCRDGTKIKTYLGDVADELYYAMNP